MLERDPAKRYQTLSDVMRHPWFDDVVWGHILSKTAKPPLVPDITEQYLNADDGSDEEDSNNASRLSVFGGTPD